MKVSDLIKLLQKCDQNAEVRFEYDCDGGRVEEDVNFVQQITNIEHNDEDMFACVVLLH